MKELAVVICCLLLTICWYPEETGDRLHRFLRSVQNGAANQ